MNNQVRLALIAIGGFLFLADRLGKFFSTDIFVQPILPARFFGWYPSANHGIAFSIPIPLLLTILLSLCFIAVLFWLMWREDSWPKKLCLYFILVGASSNLFDRLYFGHTLDYILFFTAIINLADVLIVGGVAGYLYFHLQHKK